MSLKVVRTDAELEVPLVDRRLREYGASLVLLPETTSTDRLANEVRDADLLLMCYAQIPARVIEGATRLRGIVKYGVGIDAIDIDAARRRGIPVVNVPEYAEETVAEGAVSLMLALARKFKPLSREMDMHGWAWPTAKWLALDLAGKTLGLVGVGRIGASVARIAGQGLRMCVLGFDPHVDAARMSEVGVEKCADLREMLSQCDFVSVHCVLSPQTRHLIGERELGWMKSTAFLVNVSRGAIVDETALVRALQQQRIAGAALDVYGEEPLAKSGHPLSALYAMENVILWPHLTFYTAEAMQRLEEETLARCFEMLEGRPVLVKSRDPRLRAQKKGVRFED
ncbi:MAG TPA: C-terminal binding protein [Casimicrobiaceae bacterium]|nr:C-terminal binding protein [Casimicrobiaceae bacterium]